MHIRFSTAIGLPVVEDEGEETIAAISGILIHPDMGKIEGFFVSVSGFLHASEYFLSTSDILHWGNRVRVSGTDALSSLEDLVRLQALVEERRPVLGQPIVSESGIPLGVCRDLQFDTVTFYAEWLFPRRWWRWGPAIPVSSIVLVKREAIIVRDAVTLPEVATGPSVLTTLDPLGSGGTAQ